MVARSYWECCILILWHNGGFYSDSEFDIGSVNDLDLSDGSLDDDVPEYNPDTDVSDDESLISDNESICVAAQDKVRHDLA